ncbi:MAG TPA: MFS transporter [Roseiflexaceae bacterium]|nr:MFS transporter [Roseiflexaceae bacterium]HMP42059.1 MFS transporter [Roseiflexaceae bacterium]
MTSEHAYAPPANGWRTFVIIWITQALSVFGSAITGFALTIWLTVTAYPAPEQRQELAFALAAMGISFFLAGLIAAPIGGAWADRHDRKTTMIVADVASGLVSILLVALLLTNTLNLWLLLGLNVIAGIANTFHDSAFDASYAMLVPREKLPRANGMMQTIWALSGVFSPALAASLIALPALLRQSGVTHWLSSLSDGTVLAIGLDIITFLVAVAALSVLHVPSPKRTDVGTDQRPQASIWADVREGARYIWQRRAMLWLLGTFTVVNFTAAPLYTLLPLVTRYNLGLDAAAIGMSYEASLALINSVMGIGGVLGGLAMSTWGGLKRRRIFGVLIPMIISAIAEVAFGLSSLVYLTAAMGFVTAAMIPILNAHSQAIWQSITPNELQGRVFSVRRVIAQFTLPIGTIIAGVTGGIFDPGMVIAVMAMIAVVFCTLQLFNPTLRRIEDHTRLSQ